MNRLFSASKLSTTANLRKKRQNQQLIYIGAPLLIFLLGGSYFLSIFMETHYELKDKQNDSKSVRKFDLEEEHRKLMKSLDIDSFTLSRIPRPEEETKSNESIKEKKK